MEVEVTEKFNVAGVSVDQVDVDETTGALQICCRDEVQAQMVMA